MNFAFLLLAVAILLPNIPAITKTFIHLNKRMVVPSGDFTKPGV
ncbi:MAG TPA: hypothetical protein VIU12_09115 [Chryseolinea sp.]